MNFYELYDFFIIAESNNFAKTNSETDTMKAIFSSEIIDAHKHRMIMAGGDLSRFQTNPVLLFVHNEESVPVGIVKNLRVENKQLVGDVQWDVDDPEAMKIKAKYDNGYMRGFSIRATIKKFHNETIDGKKVSIIDEWELVEISCVSVPANREALVIEKSITQKNTEGVEEESPEVIVATFFSNYQKSNIKMNKDIFKKLGIVAAELQTEDEVLKKIGDLETRAINAEGDLAKKLGDLNLLKDEINTLKEEASTKKINDLVDGAVNAKKILAGEADSFKKLALGNFDTVKSILDAKVGVVSATEQMQDAAGENETLKTYNEHKSKGYDYFWKKEPKVLAELKKTYPSLLAELEKTIKPL